MAQDGPRTGRPRTAPERPQDCPKASPKLLPQRLPYVANCQKGSPEAYQSHPNALKTPLLRGGAPRSAGSKLMAICYLWKQNVRWTIDHHRVRERHALGNLVLHDFTYGFACNRKLQTNYTELPTGTIRCMLEIYHAKARSIWKAFKPLPQAQRLELRAPSPLIPAC